MSTVTENKGVDLLKEVANISGKPGLFRVLKPGRSGVIVESLDGKREKQMIGANAQVSVLKDVSIFTDADEDSTPLETVFLSIRSTYGEILEIDPKKASDKEYIEFLNSVLPAFDRSKVYVSDIKKIISWYSIISKYLPEVFTAAPQDEEVAKEEA